MSEPIEVPQKYLDALELIEGVYDVSPVGGVMHIVLDDRNLETEHILYCVKLAAEHLEREDRGAGQPENTDHWNGTCWVAIQLGARMLEMTMEERECLMQLWDRQRKGLPL